MRPASAPVTYRPEIDGLRCIAVLAVMLYHAGFGVARGGFVGVDVFFVISGYLITRFVAEELRAGSFSLLRFYERRVRRIFPALFVMVATTTAVGLLLMSPAQLREHGHAVMAVATFASNLYFQATTGYFGRQAAERPLLHTWSLAVEEQFYLVFPLALALAWRLTAGRVRPWLAAAGLLSLALCLWRLHRGNDMLNFYGAASRAWELLLGAVLAVHGPRPHADSPVVPRAVASWTGLALIVLPIALFNPGDRHPGPWTLLPVAGTGLLLAFADPRHGAGRWLAQPPCVRIGLLSYSAYLWHQPLFALAVLAWGHHPGALAATALLLLCLLVGALSWRFVERPWREPGRLSRRTVWTLAGLGTALLLATGAGLYASGGWPQRYGEVQLQQMAAAVRSPKAHACHFEGERPWPEQACHLPDGGPAHWAVLGDSHAIELAWALSRQLSAAGHGGVLQLSASGCPPALTLVTQAAWCPVWLARAMASLQARAEVHTVVLLWRHSFYLHGDASPNGPGRADDAPAFRAGPDEASARSAYLQDLQQVVRRLLDAGKTVILLDPLPELGRPIEYQLFSRLLPEAERALGPDRAFYRRRHADILAALEAFPAHARLLRVTSADSLCEGERCLAISDGQLLYVDDNHLSLAGAERLARQVLARADEAGIRSVPAAAARGLDPPARR